MEFRSALICTKCQQPIVSGAGFGFGYVCFKIPGKESYLFFHRRTRSGGWWEAYIKESPQK